MTMIAFSSWFYRKQKPVAWTAYLLWVVAAVFHKDYPAAETIAMLGVGFVSLKILLDLHEHTCNQEEHAAGLLKYYPRRHDASSVFERAFLSAQSRVVLCGVCLGPVDTLFQNANFIERLAHHMHVAKELRLTFVVLCPESGALFEARDGEKNRTEN